jgi:hypothetical protein
MDKNKCPKFKTQNTFWNFFVIESFDQILLKKCYQLSVKIITFVSLHYFY